MFSPIPADVPSIGVQTILREPSGNFVIIYTNAENTTASRFTLGTATSTPIAIGEHNEAKLDFSATTHAQDNSTAYFFGTSGVRIIIQSNGHLETPSKDTWSMCINLKVPFPHRAKTHIRLLPMLPHST
jgi:hypothetical protein